MGDNPKMQKIIVIIIIDIFTNIRRRVKDCILILEIIDIINI